MSKAIAIKVDDLTGYKTVCGSLSQVCPFTEKQINKLKNLGIKNVTIEVNEESPNEIEMLYISFPNICCGACRVNIEKKLRKFTKSVYKHGGSLNYLGMKTDGLATFESE